MCKKIHRGGGAEQYNAEKKYQEAATAAKLACAAEDFVETLRKKGVVSEEDQREVARQLAARHKSAKSQGVVHS